MLLGQFWGTSAAEGVPAPFCGCPVCEEARAHPEYRRLRTCMRLSDQVMVDLGADAVIQSMKYGDLREIEHVLITHTHEDHLNPHMLMEAWWCREQRGTLHYYFTDKAFDMVEHWRQTPWVLKGMVPMMEREGVVAFHKLEYGKRHQINDLFVTPLRGNHVGNVGEHSALYLIELPDGRTLFYGLDSGPYFPETLEALKGRHIDIMASECAFGTIQCQTGQHQDIYTLHQLTQLLFSQGTLDEKSQLFITHFNHGTSYTAMLQAVQELNFPIPTTVCHDGIKIL